MADKCFQYNARGRRETGFDNWLDHVNYGHPSNPEYQDECQYMQEKAEFEDWLNSFQNGFNEAVKSLGKTGEEIESYEDLENAFFKRGKFEPIKKKVEVDQDCLF